MTERVIDASVLALAVIGRNADAVHVRRALTEITCHAPHLIDAEFGNVLRKRTRAGDVTLLQARTALATASSIVDVRYPHSGDLSELAWAMRDNLSFYDGLYVALAVRLDLPLWTADHRLSRAPGLPCAVELV
jgi:predicted nucleic acid-binding protein